MNGCLGVQLAVVGYLNGYLVSYGWAGYGKTPHAHGVSVSFAPGHRYNYKAFTAPAFRGRHLRGSYGHLEAADAKRGVTHSIAFIDYRNKASQSAETRNGGYPIGYAGFIKIGALFLSYSSPGARHHAFNFSRQQ